MGDKLGDASLESWTSRLNGAIAAVLVELTPRLHNDSIALLAVDCHPWHGAIAPAVLTGDELARDPTLADPALMAEWRYYDAASLLGLGAARLLIPLGEEMRAAYYAAEDHPAAAVKYLQACAAAATSPQVAEALRPFRLEPRFRVSVTHPDSNQEFVAVK